MADASLNSLPSRVVAGRQEGLLARSPRAGLAMFLLGVLVFLALLWNVKAHGPLIPWDVAVSQQLHALATHSSSFVRWLMLTGGFIGQSGVIYLGLALGVYWAFRRRWHEILMLALGAGGAEALFQILSNLVNRHRPVFPDPLEVLPGPGFPSGHCTVAVAFFGLLVYLLLPRLQGRWQRVALVVGLVVLLAYIGYSRLFQGVHYPTDVLAGYAAGLAWSGLVYTPLELARHGRRRDSLE